MIIDSHIHIGNEQECAKIIKTSKYKDIYRLYSCIDPRTIGSTEIFLKDVDKFFAIPLFFCETNIEKANIELLRRIENIPKAVPTLLLARNQHLNDLISLMDYNILKEHFSLHDPKSILDRNETYDYLNSKEGFLLLHTLSNSTYQHVMNLRKEYPRMKIIVAHLGRNGLGDYDFTADMIDKFHSDENIFTDISTIKDPNLIKYVFNRFGKFRILYGSDFPFENGPEIRTKDYIQPALRANLTSDEYDRLFFGNAQSVIKMSKVENRGGNER